MLESTWRKYKDRGVVFVGIAYADTESGSRAFLKEFDITYPNGPDLGTEIVLKYRIKGVPETFFIGKDGLVYGNYIGPFGSEAALTTKLDELLKK